MSPCTVCGAEERRLVFSRVWEDGPRGPSLPALEPALRDALPPVWDYLECSGCGLVHCDAMATLTPAQIAEFYQYEAAAEDGPRRNRANRAVRFVEAGLRWWPRPAPRTLLCYGVGRSPEPARFRARGGFTVSTCDYGPGFTYAPDTLEGQYGIISSMEVLEHFQRPGDDLARVLAHLAPGGFLAASSGLISRVPAIARPSWWYANHRVGHVTLWTLQALDLVAQRAGCVVVVRGKTYPLCGGMRGLGQFPIFMWKES